jgi:hypothetical protein
MIAKEIYYPYQKDSDTFNLWRGLAVKPKKGKDCVKTQVYIKDILCKVDNQRYDLVDKWIAHALRHPDRLSETALVYNPRRVLVTSELRSHRDKSLRGVNAIWNEILERGELIQFTRFGEFYDVPVIKIYELINRGRSKRELFSDVSIGLALKELVPDLERYRDSKRGRQYFYRFPSLAICRQGMDKLMGSERNWNECLQDEWIIEPFDRNTTRISSPVFDPEENDRAVKTLFRVIDNTKKDSTE